MEITVEIKKRDERILALTEQVGEGSFGKHKVNLRLTIPYSTLIVGVDGIDYELALIDIAEQVAKKVIKE